MLWIDSVGGYLLFAGGEVTVGQAAADADLPVMGDLSRRHATFRREGERWLIDPGGHVEIDGRPVTDLTPLPNQAELRFGSAVSGRFRQPHPLSATARLDFESRGRTRPAADGVLLLAETCLVGPETDSHIVCPNWPDRVVLVQRKGRLVCRSSMALRVAGQPLPSGQPLPVGSPIENDYVSFRLEGLG